MLKRICGVAVLRGSFCARSLSGSTAMGAILFVLGAALVSPVPAYAYIGPGAGFAFLGSTAVFLVTFLFATLTIISWPLQWLFRFFLRKGVSRWARTRRVVIVGLDGLEPSLVERYMAAGRLPNMKRLAEGGAYRRLGTTLPALSPVAWSSFQTGVNPGAHNIFDFLTRDKRFCLPLLSSTEMIERRRGIVSRLFGRGKGAEVRLTRRSTPFWRILGRHGIFSNVLRVPISYPPEPCFGNVLSAMCTPDLRGTQGSFTLFTTGVVDGVPTGGEFQRFVRDGEVLRGELQGPPHPYDPRKTALRCPFALEITGEMSARLTIGERAVMLTLNRFSDWVEIEFRYGRRRAIAGIVRFCLRGLTPDVVLYISPINVSPVNPACPIAAPIPFARWLAREIGVFGTLGLMEDTWGRNEHALDDRTFLDQTWLTHAEREAMFFELLKRTREGVCMCVFDASDRIQHMFWRYHDPKHPAPREPNPDFEKVIPEMYERMDALVGKVMSKLRDGDVLVVLSDHGFSSFRRTVDLNRFLVDEGYLVLKESGETPSLRYADWSKTRAYALGLSGLYLNRKGREGKGIVEREEVDHLKREIAGKLEQLRDPLDGSAPVRKVYDSAKEYHGLYCDEAPDLIVGFTPGYRVSWESVTGRVGPTVFGDNTKAWSGDHHVDPELVPGILFVNRPVTTEKPHIVDIAPTVLDLFAVKVPPYMEGRVIV